MIRTALIRTAAHEPVRYVAVGGFVAVTNNVVLIGGDRLGIAYPALVLLTWVIGGSIAFALHSHVTFRVAPSRVSYVQFMGGVAFGIPLSLALLALFVSWLKLPMWIAAPLATLAMFLFNYLNARTALLWRWRRRRRNLPKDARREFGIEE